MGRMIEEENFDSIGKMIDKISMKVTETQEKYIFETIKPYCDYITKQEITKEELAEALLLRQNYENRLKADIVAVLTDIQLEIEELDTPSNGDAYMTCSDIIQQKINALKAESGEDDH